MARTDSDNFETADSATLLGTLYEAILEDSGFQSFVEAVCEVFDCKSATIRAIHAQSMESLWLWNSDTDAAFNTCDVSQLAMCTRQVLATKDNARAAGGIVMCEDDWITELVLHRSSAQSPLSSVDLKRLDILIPYLQRAVKMRQRFIHLQLNENLLVSALDILPVPAMLFAENCRLAFINSCATADVKLRAHFTVDDGHFLAEDNMVTRKVNQELTKAIRAGRSENVEPSVVMLPRVDQFPMIMMFAPLRSAERARGALLFIFDPSATHRLTAELVRRLFRLSQTEALVVALCSGKSLDDAACERGVSVHTTRSQLKSILQKTGTSRQTELMSLVLANKAQFFLSATALGVKSSNSTAPKIIKPSLSQLRLTFRWACPGRRKDAAA